jgi:hypothetical protein
MSTLDVRAGESNEDRFNMVRRHPEPLGYARDELREA